MSFDNKTSGMRHRIREHSHFSLTKQPSSHAEGEDNQDKTATKTGQPEKNPHNHQFDEALQGISHEELKKAEIFRKYAYPFLSACLFPVQYILSAVLKLSMGSIYENSTPIDFENYILDVDQSISKEQRAHFKDPIRMTNGVSMPNRIVKAGITDGLCDFNGNPTPSQIQLYKRYGQGGFGMIISPSTSVDRRAIDPSIGNAPILDIESDLYSFRSLASAMKQKDTLGILQLTHPGPLVAYNQSAFAPSPFISKSGRNVINRSCQVLEGDEIEDIIAKFVVSLSLAEDAGFDGVQILAANGYLGSVFLSKHINTRTDKWAGDQFIIELMQRLLDARKNSQFILGIKMNSSDLQKGGLSHEEALQTMAKLSSMGIDFIEIGGGTYQYMDTRYSVNNIVGASSYKRESFFIDFAEKVSSSEDILVPILAVGGWQDVGAMLSALKKNSQLLVGFGRASCIDPNLANRLINTSIKAIPNWFKNQIPDWIATKSKSENREERSVAFALEMLWHTLATTSLSNGETVPKINGAFDNPLAALGIKIHLFMKGFLPRSWLSSFYTNNPVAQTSDE